MPSRLSKLGIEENNLNLIWVIYHNATGVFNSEIVEAFSLKSIENTGGCFCFSFRYCTPEALANTIRQKIWKI